MNVPTKQTEWTRAYNEKAYDRLAITIPKGCKSLIETAARSVGESGESINGYVNAAILARLGLVEWPVNKSINVSEEC